MRRQTLWVAMAFAMATVGAVPEAMADFVNDSLVQLKLKNFYLDRQYDSTPTKNWGSWSQGVTLDAKSGYTQIGQVKIGVDLLAEYAERLNGRDRNRDWVLPYEGTPGTGKQTRQFGKIGATLKAKIGQTELRIGEILPVTPVVVFDPSRQLLTTYNGVWLEAKDIQNTKITMGYLKSINARYESHPMDFGLWPKNLNKDGLTDGMYVAGLDYQFNKHVSGSYFYADVTNIYRQNFVGVNYKNADSKLKVDSHVRYFDNAQTGDALYGGIDSQALSLGSTFSYGPHSLGLSYQQMFGGQGSNSSAATGAPYFPSLAGWVPQPYLDNWSVLCFIRKDEQSVGLNYSYDFSDVGIKGLKATAKYWSGWNIDSAYESNRSSVKLMGQGKENETNFILNYVVPEGSFKGLGFQWMYIDAKFHNVQGQPSGLKENRIATTYTYTF